MRVFLNNHDASASQMVATFRRTKLRTLLERAIVHLLNGDEDKAAALFHKFMVERARQIHESLRQNENVEDSLDENWDSEIKEEEYFGDDDFGHDDEGGEPEMANAAPDMGSGDGDEFAPADDGLGGDVEEPDAVPGDEFGGDDIEGDSEPGLEGKIDDLTDKIDQLTAEFDRVMADFHDEGDDDVGIGDDDGGDFGGDAPADEFGGDETVGAEGGDGDLAGRMEDDMVDDDTEHEPVAEGELPDFIKDKMKDKDGDDGDKDEDDQEIDESDDLRDITESVLAELEKVAPVANTEDKGIGSNSVKSQISAGNKVTAIPHHNVMDRIKGEPVMTKGPTYKGYAREEAPKVAGAETLVKSVRPENRRKSFKDTMKTVDAKGDASALLHKDFAPGMPKPTKSIIDGKTSKG